MSSVQSALASQPKRQYVSSAVFNKNIFSYTLSTNPATNVTTGDVSANIVGATALTCPAGRILRESGLKLYPGVNNGVNTYLVGVVDTITLLAGYIDPNSPVFAVYSNQLPFMPPYGTNPNGVDPGPQGLPDEGPPVYTNGDVICVSGNIVTQTGSITSATTITAATGITSTTGNILAASGEVLASSGIGYNVTPGAVNQIVSNNYDVSNNSLTGIITMFAGFLNAGANVDFYFYNSNLRVNDFLLATIRNDEGDWCVNTRVEIDNPTPGDPLRGRFIVTNIGGATKNTDGVQIQWFILRG